MFPYVGAYPCTAHVPARPARAVGLQSDGVGHCPYVGIVAETPSAVNPIVVPGGACAAFGQVVYPSGHGRFVELPEGGDLRRPVVLFNVYVGGVVAAPGREEMLVPQPLQVGGYSRGAAA